MKRRQFMGLAVGTASLWLPGCAAEAPAPSDMPTGAPDVSPPGVPPAEMIPELGATASVGDARAAFSPDGRSFVITDHHIEVVTPNGGSRLISATRSTPPTNIGDLDGPVRVIWDEAGKRLLVLEIGNRRIQAFDASGRSLGVVARTELPGDMLLAADRSLYVSEPLMHRVQVFAPDGRQLRTIGAFGEDAAGLNGPLGVAIAPDGTLHVVDAGSRQVKVFTTSGRYVARYGAGQLTHPRGIAFDAEGRAWVADRARGNVAIFGADGRLEERFVPRLDGRTAAPIDVAIRADGTMYVAAA